MTLLRRMMEATMPLLRRRLLTRRGLFIRTESTPNENSLIFKPGQTILDDTDHTLEFRTAHEAKQSSELADRLFGIPGVETVMFGRDFISVNKEADSNWQHLKPAILAAISNHLQLQRPILRINSSQLDIQDDQQTGISTTQFRPEDAEVVAMIKEVLDTKVRPAVQGDGGDVRLVGYADGVVELTLRGACRSCSSSTVTLKHGIENLLLHYIPEVKEVRQVEDPLETQSYRYFEKVDPERNPTKK